MQPRRIAPAPEIEYFLDGAQEAVELDSCSAMTLRLYGDDAAMQPIVGGRGFSHYKERRKKALVLASLADAILPELTPRRRGGLVRLGLSNIITSAYDLAEVLSSWAIDDAIEGGAMLPFRQRHRARGTVVFKRTARRLGSPRFIRRYVRELAPEHGGHLRILSDLMVRRAAGVEAKSDHGLMADWRAQFNHSVKAATRHHDVRAQRKMIVRSFNVAVSVLGRETVDAFLRGEEVKMIGTETMLVIRKRGSLTDRGHGCLSVGLADRNGTRLADLCTFVEDTPTLDQLSAFALWMEAGEERQIVETANIINLAPEGRGNPILVKHQEARAVDALARLIQDVGPEQADRIAALMGRPAAPPRRMSYEEHRARNNAYWEETKGHWIEAMLVFVVGYRNFPVFKQAGVL